MRAIARTSAKVATAGIMLGLAIVATTGSVFADTVTVRDHRGPKGAPQGGVTVETGGKPKDNILTPRSSVTTNGGTTTRDHRPHWRPLSE